MIRVGDRVQHHHRDPEDIGVVTSIDARGYVDVDLDNGQRMGGPARVWVPAPEHTRESAG